MYLWERYFLKELFKFFSFFLLSFFFLYSLLDFSMHMDDFFKEHHLQMGELLRFYLSHFLKRVDLLLPLALLVSSIKVLTSLNIRREWMALQVAGLSTRKLLRPFLFMAGICALFNWVNFEYFLPSALNQMDEFHATHFKSSHRAKRKELIHLLTLKDRSKLLYQSYDAEKKALFDVLWIRSPDDIWRIKFLDADPAHPEGQYVDHIVRKKDGFLEKKESFDTLYLTELKWNPKQAGKSFIPFENRSLKELVKLGLQSTHTTPYEIPKILTQLCFKILIPLLSFFVIWLAAPFCIGFSRFFNPFFIYAWGVFALLAFYMLIDSSSILGAQNIISPWVALFTPFIVIGTFSFFKYRKLCA